MIAPHRLRLAAIAALLLLGVATGWSLLGHGATGCAAAGEPAGDAGERPGDAAAAAAPERPSPTVAAMPRIDAASSRRSALPDVGADHPDGATERAPDALDRLGREQLDARDLESARSTLSAALATMDRRWQKLVGAVQGDRPAAAATLHDEAETALLRSSYAAFLTGLDRGSYYLVEGSADRLPTPEGHTELGFDVAHHGRTMHCVVLVQDREHGLDRARMVVDARRRDWLASIADAFNARPDAQRQELVARHAQGLPEDDMWRRLHFPAGLRVEPQRALLVVE